MRQIITGVLVLLGWMTLAACAPSQSVSSTRPSARGNEAASMELVALVYDPVDGSLLKADSQGLWRWRVGSSWQAIPVSAVAAGLSSVVINPDQPVMIYVGGPGLGVIESDDGGETWQARNTGLPSLNIDALALHSFRRSTLYAWVRDYGIYRTEDSGATWEQVPDAGPSDTDVRHLTHSTLPGSMNTGWLYAATPSGAYLSMDCF
jgi:photosystem II stability/assembly factor-like uncharacterized protein